MKYLARSENYTHVVLSERNVRKLLEMLDKNVGMPALSKKTPHGGLIVSIESDEQHYKEKLFPSSGQ